MTRLLFIWFGGCTLLLGCLSARESFCAKKYMNAHKLIYIDNGRLTEKYFLVQDSLQFEFSGNTLYSESKIIWNTCNSYSLVIKKIYYEGDGLRPGDTLVVGVQSFNKDTITCIASAHNYSFSIKLLKSTVQ